LDPGRSLNPRIVDRTEPANISPGDGRRIPAPGPGSHIPALDAVRGVAILLVMVFHFSSYGHGLVASPLWIDRLYYAISRAGWIGVDLFFVLSGFLITGILYDAKDGERYFRNFYARRVLRIFPLYYGALALFVVVLPRLFSGTPGVLSLSGDAVWYWTYLSNVRIASGGWPEFAAIGHFWSLAIEEQFYLLWPVLVLALSRRHLMVACAVFLVGALATRVGLNLAQNRVAAFVLTPARIDALAVGAYLALAARGPGGLASLSRVASRAAVLTGASLLATFVVRRGFAAPDPVVSTLGHTLLAGFFGAVLVLALTGGRESAIARVFDSATLRFFGRYSYGLYVVHHPILFLRSGVVPLAIVPSVFGSQLLRQAVFLVVATGVSVGIALVSWHLYEKQFLKLKALFPYEPAGRGPAPTQLEGRVAPGLGR
jgi:peptidoglycan/LPS O-acetylase OafA/YrhL